MATLLTCSQCGNPVAPADFACGACGQLLVDDTPDMQMGPQQEESAVSGLRAPPAAPVEERVVWRRELSDAERAALLPLDAQVAALVDGVRTVSSLAAAAGLPEVEVRSVLEGLVQQGLVELQRTPASGRLETPSSGSVAIGRIGTRKMLVRVRREEAVEVGGGPAVHVTPGGAGKA